MTITKVKIVEKDNSLTDAVYIHDSVGEFHLFIDKNQKIRTNINQFIFISETPIITI